MIATIGTIVHTIVSPMPDISEAGSAVRMALPAIVLVMCQTTNPIAPATTTKTRANRTRILDVLRIALSAPGPRR